MALAPERWTQIKEVFAATAELSGAERNAALDRLCTGDQSLRVEVESLLNSDSAAAEFMATAVATVPADLFDEDALTGRRIGAYRIVRELGRGGLGVVYLAERADEQFHKSVAIKFIKRGLDTDAIQQRFRREREILASLDHPNIARLLDAGITDDGLSYFVMELVEGHAVTDYCRETNLRIEQRLRLFCTICAAVNYAHQRLVIHRDLKPSNILVNNQGETKLLDFGIAKLLHDDAVPGQTVAEQRLLTPEYASPEQVRHETISTASDIYSLGVILYEVLTGEKPLRGAHGLITRPSSVVSNSQFGTRDQKSLRGDVDNIILKALSDDPSRRYSSASQMADDIGRHLAGLPVSARPETWRYVAGKFIRRNKALVSAALLALLALVVGTIATALEAHRAREQRQRAEQRFEDVRRLADSLIFEIHDAVQNLQGATPARRLIVARALEYLDRLSKEAADNRALQRDLATAYEKIGDIQGNPYFANLGDKEGADQSYHKAEAIRTALARVEPTVENRIALGRTQRGLGDILLARGDIAGMLARYRQSLDSFESLTRDDPDNTAGIDELARAWETLGDGLEPSGASHEQMRDCYERARTLRQKLLAREPGNAKVRRSIAVTLMKIGQNSLPDKVRAVDSLRQAIGIFEDLARENPDDARARREVGTGYYALGTLLVEAGDYAEALEARRKELAIHQAVADGNPQDAQARFDLATAHANVSEALHGIGDWAGAISEGKVALDLFDALVREDPTNAIYLRNQALACERLAEACKLAANHDVATTGDKAMHWQEAADWYERERDLFVGLRDRGALRPVDKEKPEQLAKAIAECRQAVGAGEAKRPGSR